MVGKTNDGFFLWGLFIFSPKTKEYKVSPKPQKKTKCYTHNSMLISINGQPFLQIMY